MQLLRRHALAVGLFAAAAVAIAVHAQAPAPGPEFAGTWTLDTYLSDNPEQVAHVLQYDTGGASSDVFSGPVDRGGYPQGGARGGYGGFGGMRPRGDAGRSRPTPPKKEDADKLKELTDAIQYPAPTLTITQAADTITFGDGQGRSRTFHTTGKKEAQTLGAGAVTSTAMWQGPELAVTVDVASAGRVIYTYSIVPTTKQLLVRVGFERTDGEAAPLELRQVYNRQK